jgi:hypothetical protein
MYSNSYTPWQIPSDTTPRDEELIAFLIRFAVLAPSSHNTQPWRFRVQNDTLELYTDPDRKLGVADPQDRELYMSIGAALENISRAAESIQRAIKIEYVLAGDLVARIVFVGSAGSRADYREAMIQRRSTRLPFSLEPLPEDLVKTLSSIGRGGTKTLVFEKRAEIESIARISSEASGRALSNPVFRHELVKWVRNNWTRQPDGMPGFTQGIPGPVSLLAPLIMRLVDVGPDQAKKDYELLAASPCLVVLTAKRDELRGWIDAGRTYQAVCLLAQSNGFQTSSLASAIEDEAAVKGLYKKLSLTDRPVAILRVGKASRLARHSPRRSADSVSR